MQILIEQISSPGGRENNEDYCAYQDCGGRVCLSLADGLGGHSGGEMASYAAVDAAMTNMVRGGDVASAFEAAQLAVLQKQEQDPRLSKMRTTLVAATITDGVLNYGHIGDSRLYIFKKKKVALITPDHSVTHVLYKTGDIRFENMREDPNRNKVLRVVGEPSAFKPAMAPRAWTMEPRDAVLLCSDGLWEHVHEDEMEKALRKAKKPGDWIAQMEKMLLKRAKKGHDNYTAIGVMFV